MMSEKSGVEPFGKVFCPNISSNGFFGG